MINFCHGYDCVDAMIESGNRPRQLNIVENFLSDSEIKDFNRVLLEEMEWSKQTKYYPDARQHYTLKNDWSNNELVDLDVLIKNRLHPIIEEFFSQLVFIPANLSYNRWMVGDSMGCHNDSGHPSGELIIEKRGLEPPPVPISEHLNEIASVIYLTDNFDGGEIFFPNFGYAVKPSAGSAISFPANHFFSHGVNELISGERLTITIFWPGVRAVALSLMSSIYEDWWQRVRNPEKIFSVLPSECINVIQPKLIPPNDSRK